MRERPPVSLAEGVGFEPTVGRTHNGFRDRPIRPLSHPSERGASLPAGGEEVGEQGGGLLGKYAAADGELVVETGVGAQVVQRAAGAGARVDRAEHEAAEPGGDE